MKQKLLFVCTANKQRSRTAEDLYRRDPRFEVCSAGISEFADRPINEEMVVWADQIIVMEEGHKREILRRFPDLLGRKKVINLDIPDVYFYMDPELQDVLRVKLEKLFPSL